MNNNENNVNIIIIIMKTSDRQCKHVIKPSDWYFGEKTITWMISHGFVRQSKRALSCNPKSSKSKPLNFIFPLKFNVLVILLLRFTYTTSDSPRNSKRPLVHLHIRHIAHFGTLVVTIWKSLFESKKNLRKQFKHFAECLFIQVNVPRVS